MAKSADAFRTISEVAEWLDLPSHVLRFWESKFTQVKPVKRAGGRRYYRPADMLLLGGIKKLLHDDGMTIKGAQKMLREKGVKEVAALSQPLDTDSISEETAGITGLEQSSEIVADAPFIDAAAPDAEADVISFAHRAPSGPRKAQETVPDAERASEPLEDAPAVQEPGTDEPRADKPSQLPSFLGASHETEQPVAEAASLCVDLPDDPSDTELDVPAGVLSRLVALKTEPTPEMRQALEHAQSALKALSA